MSDQIKHECGIAMLRLLKPLEYYQEKYGNTWALNRMYLLMEKQHNRGQDGAGLANIKFDTKPGEQYINITRKSSVVLWILLIIIQKRKLKVKHIMLHIYL